VSAVIERRRRDARRRRSQVGAGRAHPATYVPLLLLAAFFGAPLLWLVDLALRPNDEIYTADVHLLPHSPTLSNFTDGWSGNGFAQLFANSAFITGSTVLLSVVFSSLAGYALAKFQFWGKNLLFLTCLAAIIVPDQVRMVPLYTLMLKLHWVDSYQAVILPGISQAFAVFLMKQHIEKIPDSLIEAARVDGAGELRILWKIVLPLSKPAIVTVILFEGLYRWNDFLWPLVVLKSNDMQTVTMGLARLQSDPSVGGGIVIAMAMISAIPIIALFIVCQRYFIEGIASTGTRG
jgi:ABC-type glycerol-3-phosphate transport system permease component